MSDIINLVKSALNIIEKLKAQLPDDTYLDKFVSGLREKCQTLPLDNLESIIEESNLKQFCERNFHNENIDLQNFSFKLCSVLCSAPQTLSRKWISKCAELLEKFKIWPVISSLFELLRLLIQESKVDIQIVWKQLLAQVILGQNQDRSHFWKNSAKKLFETYLLSIVSQFETIEDSFKERIVQVLNANLIQNEIMSQAVTEVFRTIDENNQRNLEIMFQNENMLPLEARVIKKMKQNIDAASILNENFDNTTPKIWISSSKIYLTRYSNEEIEDKCLSLAENDYKIIPSLVSVPVLYEKLWDFIFLKFLSTYLSQEEGEIPLRDLNGASDMKLLSSCISNLNNLVSKIKTTSQNHWNILVKLSIVPELTPIYRSNIIDLMKKLLENSKIQMSLESLASQLWHLLRYQDWETRDAILYCLSTENLTSDSNDKVPKALVGLVKSGLCSESSFVRKASLNFLSKLWKIEENCINDIHGKIEKILQTETEAIVRRQATQFVLHCLGQGDHTSDIMILASKDLDWEVKKIAFQYWIKHLDQMLENQEKDFNEFMEYLKKCRILEGLQMVYKDYEKALQNECLQYLKMFKAKLLKKYPKATLKENLMTVHHKLHEPEAKKPKMQVDFLIDILHDIDYDTKLLNYQDYCEHHYGFISVLSDIIQVDANESNIDTIDCF